MPRTMIGGGQSQLERSSSSNAPVIHSIQWYSFTVQMTKGVNRGNIPIVSDFSRKPNLKQVGVCSVTAGFPIAIGRTALTYKTGPKMLEIKDRGG